MYRNNVFYPNYIANVIYEPGKKIYGFHIIFDKKMADKYKLQNILIEKISRHKGIIKFLKLYPDYRTNDTIVILFLDLSVPSKPGNILGRTIFSSTVPR